MGKDKLDKLVKDKLYDLHTPIDTNNLWSNIETKMESEETTPIHGFSIRKYLGLALLAVLLLSSFYFLQEQSDGADLSNIDTIGKLKVNSNTSPASANDHSNSKTTTTNFQAADTKEIQDVSKDSKTISTAAYNSSTAGQQDLNQKQSFDSKEISTRKNTLASKNRTNNNLEISTSKSVPNPNFKQDATPSKSIRTDETDRTEKLLIAKDKTSLSKTSNNQFIERKNEGNTLAVIQSEKKEFLASNDHEQLLEGQDKILAISEKQSALNQMLSIEKLQSYGSGQLQKDANMKDVCKNLKGDACNPILRSRNRVDCYDNWTAERSKLSILPYIGIEFVTNDGSRADTMTNYLAERESTMKHLEVLKAGLLFKYNLNQNLYIKSGIEYDQIREKFETTLITTDKEINPMAVIAYTITMEGDTLPVHGPGETTVIRTTEWRKYNKYHSFNVPVIIGYEAPLSKRWDYFGEAGIFYNLKFSYDGKLLDTNNDVVSGENFFVSNTGISLYGGLGLRFNAKKRWSAFTTASYKYNLAPINNLDFNPVKQNLGLAGLVVGLEIRI